MRAGARATCSLLAVAVVIVIGLAGCSAHDGQVGVVAGGGATPGRTFVGRAVCAGCHAEINAEFPQTCHGGVNWGGDFHNKPTPANNVITGFGGACQPCHVVGFGEGGFVSDAVTPQLAGIGCEECHGPGSDHAASPSTTNIQRVPKAVDTCWDCHVNSYKILKGPPQTTGERDLRNTKPGSVSVHHPQALMLNGWLGYNRPITPGPHELVENTCVTCHLNAVKGTATLRQAGDPLHHGAGALDVDTTACAQCHGSQANAAARFARRETEIKAELIELGGEDPSNPGEPDETGSGGLLGAYATAHGIDLTTNNNPRDPAVQAYKGARFDWDYVLADKSQGTHNPGFADSLLADAKLLLSN